MCDKLIYTDTSTQRYVKLQKITLDLLCNSLSVKNTGNIICKFDDEPLQPGESKVIGGNRLQILYGRHDIAFTTEGMAIVPATQIPECWVTQLYYIDTPKGFRTELS